MPELARGRDRGIPDHYDASINTDLPRHEALDVAVAERDRHDDFPITVKALIDIHDSHATTRSWSRCTDPVCRVGHALIADTFRNIHAPRHE